jgi:hypothetical protein
MSRRSTRSNNKSSRRAARGRAVYAGVPAISIGRPSGSLKLHDPFESPDVGLSPRRSNSALARTGSYSPTANANSRQDGWEPLA